jgi:predicted acyl esterase
MARAAGMVRRLGRNVRHLVLGLQHDPDRDASAAGPRAIIPIFATDDRYTDDVHFGGGIRKAIEFGYPLFMVSENALPPVPSLAGDGWRKAWLDRIDEVVPWFDSIEEQNDGPFWRQGSLRPRYDLITVPTMIVAGWADVYGNAALRMIEHPDGPKVLVPYPYEGRLL